VVAGCDNDMPEPKELVQYQTDHDVLIELRTEFKGMREDIKDLTSANGKIADDHETRLRDLRKDVNDQASSSNNWRFILGIAVPFIAAALGWLYVSFFNFNSNIDAKINKDINTSLTNYGVINK
jgi:hypothetical protein